VVIKSLHTETDPVHTVMIQHIQFLSGQFIGICFKSKFIGDGKVFRHKFEQAVELTDSQRCRRTAADINSFEMLLVILSQFLNKSVDILVYRLIFYKNLIEVAISADSVAKWDMDIHTIH